MNNLPSGWQRTTMGRLGRYQDGRAFASREWGMTGRPIIRIQNLTGSGTGFNYYDGAVEDRHVVRPGDVLVSWAATLGVFVWDGPEGVLNQHIYKVDSHIDGRFHRYLIESKLAEMRSQAHGSGIVHITKGRFDAIPVALPPRDEQQRIARALEGQLDRVDAGRAAIGRATQLSRRLRSAAVDGVLASRTGWASGTARYPMITLNALAAGGLFTDGDWVESKDQDPAGSIRLTQLADVGTGAFRDRSDRWLNADQARRLNVTLLEAGDLLIARMAHPIARCCLVPETVGRAATVVDVSVVRLARRDVDPRYVMWALNSSSFRRSALAASSGTTRRRISRRNLGLLEIPVPPREVQEDVVDDIEQYLSAADAIDRSSVLAEGKASRLRHALLQAALSGRLEGARAGE